MRLGRDTGVASMGFSALSGSCRDDRKRRAIARASASERRAPGASSFWTDSKPISSPSGETVTYSSSFTPERNQRIRHFQILASRP